MQIAMAPSIFLAAALALAALVRVEAVVPCGGTSCVGVGSGCANANPVCTISGSTNNVCSGATQTDPSANKCKNCNASLTSTDWSNVIGGVQCRTGGDICSGTGQCLQGCWLGSPDGGGVVNTLSSPLPGNSFVANTPANNAVGLGTRFYTQSDWNPIEYKCQFCDAENAVYGFTFRPDGNACLSVSQTTTGVCQTGVCVNKCYINGAFKASGEFNTDKCGVCDPSNNPLDWTYNINDGTACPVGGPNTAANNGVCLGATPLTPAVSPFAVVSTCQPECYITTAPASAPQAANDPSPDTVCKICKPTSSTTAYTNVLNGGSAQATSCTDNAGQTCLGSGFCLDGVCTCPPPIPTPALCSPKSPETRARRRALRKLEKEALRALNHNSPDSPSSPKSPESPCSPKSPKALSPPKSPKLTPKSPKATPKPKSPKSSRGFKSLRSAFRGKAGDAAPGTAPVKSAEAPKKVPAAKVAGKRRGD